MCFIRERKTGSSVKVENCTSADDSVRFETMNIQRNVSYVGHFLSKWL